MEFTSGTFLVAPQEDTKEKHFKPSGRGPTSIETSHKNPIYAETYTAAHTLPIANKIERDSTAEKSGEEQYSKI